MRRTITIRPQLEDRIRQYRVYIMMGRKEINLTDAINNLLELGLEKAQEVTHFEQKTNKS